MDQDKIAGELVKLRSDVLYLIRVVEKLETKIVKIEQSMDTPKQQSSDPFAGKHIEKL